MFPKIGACETHHVEIRGGGDFRGASTPGRVFWMSMQAIGRHSHVAPDVELVAPDVELELLLALSIRTSIFPRSSQTTAAHDAISKKTSVIGIIAGLTNSRCRAVTICPSTVKGHD
jgi:hypothetical protein